MVEYKAKTELKVNQTKLAQEVELYPAKLQEFKTNKIDYDNAFEGANEVVCSGDNKCFKNCISS